MTSPFRISDEHFLHLTDGLDMNVLSGTPDLWDRRDRAELATGRLVSVFSYDAAWDFAERHPDGDELVMVLDGAVDFLLDAGEGEHTVHLDSGDACIVPAGTWHRAALDERCTMLFVTPVPARTEHRALRA